MVDFLVSAGIKPTAIVSYNHLGNNDGKNLSAPQTFRSKEISKSNVVDDMVHSNNIMYKPREHPDHVVVIKYVPTVADSKRAMDEYTSEIFMGAPRRCHAAPLPRRPAATRAAATPRQPASRGYRRLPATARLPVAETA